MTPDIYRFIDSADVRCFLEEKQYVFSPLEAAFVVWQSRTATLEEKHDAWQKIIETMPDTDIPYEKWKAPRESLHAFLWDYMALEDRLLREFYDSTGFCAYNYYEPEHGDLLVDHRGIFHHLDACLSAAQTALKEHGAPEIVVYRIDQAYGRRIHAAFDSAGNVLRVRPEYDLFVTEEAILRDSFAALTNDLSFMRPFLEGELLYDDAEVYMCDDIDDSKGYAENGNAVNMCALFPKTNSRERFERIQEKPKQKSGFLKNVSASDRCFINFDGEKNGLVLLMAGLCSSSGVPFSFSPPDIPPPRKLSDGFYGIPKLDRNCRGRFTSDLIGLASFGGTAVRAKEDLLLRIVLHHAVEKEESVLFFSLKAKAADVWRRLLALLSDCDPAFAEGFSPEERDRLWNAYFMLLRTRLTIVDSAATDAEALECRLKNVRPDFIAVDSLQRFNPIPELEDQRERVQYAQIAYSLKQFAKEYRVPILLSAQLPWPPGFTPEQQPEPTLRDFDRVVSNADFDQILLVHAERGKETAEASLVKNKYGACVKTDFVKTLPTLTGF